MAYTRVNWQDLPSTTTPRNATNLNKMDSAIKEHDDQLLGNAPMGSIVVGSIRTKNMFDKTTVEAGDIINNDPTLRLSSRQNLWLEAGTYTLSTNATSPFRYTIQVQNVGVPPLSSYPTYIYNSGWQSGSVSHTFTLSSSGYFTLILSKDNNATLTPSDVAGFNYQLEKGSTATAFTSYEDLTSKSQTHGNATRNSTFTSGSCTFYKIGNYVIVQIADLYGNSSEYTGQIFTGLPSPTQTQVFILYSYITFSSARVSITSGGIIQTHYSTVPITGTGQQFYGMVIYRTND